MGFKADIIVWDYEKRSLLYRLTLHKVKVEALAFSPNELYLVSLGGQDDGSVVVWNLKTADSVRLLKFYFSICFISIFFSFYLLRLTLAVGIESRSLIMIVK